MYLSYNYIIIKPVLKYTGIRTQERDKSKRLTCKKKGRERKASNTGQVEATGLLEFKAILVYSLKSEFQASLDMNEAMPPPSVCVLVYQCG